MQVRNFFDRVIINDNSATPKCLQVVNAILKAIETTQINVGEPLPSINVLTSQLFVGRCTIEKAYNYLKKRNVIVATASKRYFVKVKGDRIKFKVFILLNKLNAHKKQIYDAFVEAMGGEEVVELAIYNNDLSLFMTLFERSKGRFSHFVIMPHFSEP